MQGGVFHDKGALDMFACLCGFVLDDGEWVCVLYFGEIERLLAQGGDDVRGFGVFVDVAGDKGDRISGW